MYTPFLLVGPQVLRKLDVGVGALFGSCVQSACQQPMLTMGQERTIFQYNNSVTGNGFHTKVLPQMSWFWSRFGVMSTFIHTWEPKIDRATGKSDMLQHQAWMVQGEVALTDDEPAFNRVIPKNPFDLSKPGHWGAFTIAGRYSEQYLDPATFGLNFGSATLYARTAKGYSLDLTWYASREFRIQRSERDICSRWNLGHNHFPVHADLLRGWEPTRQGAWQTSQTWCTMTLRLRCFSCSSYQCGTLRNTVIFRKEVSCSLLICNGLLWRRL